MLQCRTRVSNPQTDLGSLFPPLPPHSRHAHFVTAESELFRADAPISRVGIISLVALVNIVARALYLKFTTQTSLPRRTAHGDCGQREKKQELSLPLQVREERRNCIPPLMPFCGAPWSSLSYCQCQYIQ